MRSEDCYSGEFPEFLTKTRVNTSRNLIYNLPYACLNCSEALSTDKRLVMTTVSHWTGSGVARE